MNDAPIRIASTTMLVRGLDELEVLMVKRNQQIDFFSGAMVFPGGKVEQQDLDPEWAAWTAGWTEVPADERGPRIAALREAFEECGVVAAAKAFSMPPTERLAARTAIEAGQLRFLDFVRSVDVRLDLSRLTLFARWLTPPIVPKRFDTFFYLVEMPSGQTAAHDGRETVDNEWVTPAAALQLAESGARTILFPTRMNLQLLARERSLADAVASARLRPRRQVMPQIEMRDGRKYLRLSEDDGYGAVEEPAAFG